MYQDVTVNKPIQTAPPKLTGGGFPWGGIAGMAGNLVSDIISARTAKRNTDRTIQANREMAEYQYSKDIEMWNLNNAYNSPEAQQLRLNKAGLNPNLVYGSGSVAGNTTGSMPKYNAPTAQYNYKPSVDPGSMIGAYQDMEMRQVQIDNARAQNRVIDMEGAIKAIEATYTDTLLREKFFGQYTNRKAKEADFQYKYGPSNLAEVNNTMYYQKQLAELARTQMQVTKMRADEELVRLNTKLKPWETAFGIAGKIASGASKLLIRKGIPSRSYLPRK